MKHDYQALVEAFCRLCGIDGADRVAAGAAVEVEGVNLALAYDEAEAPDRLFVYCDYGAVPKEREADAYRALLETNLFTHRRDTAVFTLSPQSGRVICATRFALGGLRADELRGVMTFLSRKARHWRQTFFESGRPVGVGAIKGPTVDLLRVRH